LDKICFVYQVSELKGWIPAKDVKTKCSKIFLVMKAAVNISQEQTKCKP